MIQSVSWNKLHLHQTTMIHGSLVIRPIRVSIPYCTWPDKCDVEGFGRDLDRCEDCMQSFSPSFKWILYSFKPHLMGPQRALNQNLSLSRSLSPGTEIRPSPLPTTLFVKQPPHTQCTIQCCTHKCACHGCSFSIFLSFSLTHTHKQPQCTNSPVITSLQVWSW